MRCPSCDHDVPPAPPLAEDYEFTAQHHEAQAEWKAAQKGRTMEWGYCECPRCYVCWDLAKTGKCHCPAGPLVHTSPSASSNPTTGVPDVLPHDPS